MLHVRMVSGSEGVFVPVNLTGQNNQFDEEHHF